MLYLLSTNFIIIGLSIFTNIGQSYNDHTFTLDVRRTDTRTLSKGTYRVEATGNIQTCACGTNNGNPCDIVVDANGVQPASNCSYKTYGHPMMSLFAAIGRPCTNNNVACGVYIGKSGTIVVPSDQNVYLKVADTLYYDNIGTLAIKYSCVTTSLLANLPTEEPSMDHLVVLWGLMAIFITTLTLMA